ncbi:MAG: hypothetical protein HY800_05880 [Ignavibacteriales bacterium]|nr:hypothetical protein [Ignavibacteriales bacterium]
MEHIDDKILDKLFVCPDEISSQEKNDINSHLEKCALCSEHAAKLKNFYHQLNANLESPPTERDKAFADKLLTRNRLALPEKKLALQERVDDALSTFVEIIEPYHRPLMQRFVRYIQIHPIRVASGFSMAACLAALAFFFAKPVKDVNPYFAEIKNYNVVVYNKDNEKLWSKGKVGFSEEPVCRIKDGVNGKYEVSGIRARAVLVDDINNDGINEVLFSGGMKNMGQFAQDTLYCYNKSGNILWKYYASKSLAFGNLDFTAYADWFVADYFSVINTSVHKKQLFVLSLQESYSPSRLTEINPVDGSEIQSY